MNTTTSISGGSFYTSPVIDLNEDMYKSFKMVTLTLLTSKDTSLAVYTGNIYNNLQVTVLLDVTANIASSVDIKLSKRFLKAVITNSTASTSTVYFESAFKEDITYLSLADANGTPISSLNPLYITGNTGTPDINLHDGLGNSINSTSGSLNCHIDNQPVSINIKDASGNALTSTAGSLNANITNQITTINIKDASGNALTSTAGSLNANITNQITEININDSSGDALTSTAGSLNANITNQITEININDSSGNALTSTAGSLNANITNQISAINIKDSSGNSLTSTTGSLNVHVVNSSGSTANITDSSGNSLSSSAGSLYTIAKLHDGANNSISSIDNALYTVARTDYYNDLVNNVYAAGGFGTQTTLVKYMFHREAVSTSGSDITTNTSDTYNYGLFNTSGYLTAESTSASDASGGIGARIVVINGLDDTNAQTSDQFVLNGTTPVDFQFGTTFSRINNAFVLTAGSSGTNVGKITIKDASGNELINILPKNSSSVNSNLILSSGEACIIRKMNIQTSTEMFIRVKIKRNGSSVWTIVDSCLCNGNLEKDLCVQLNGLEDFIISATAVTTAGICSIQLQTIHTSG